MSNFDKKEFGKNIRKFRKAKGLSQENLAMAINKTPATIARYENGELHLMRNKYISFVMN